MRIFIAVLIAGSLVGCGSDTPSPQVSDQTTTSASSAPSTPLDSGAVARAGQRLLDEPVRVIRTATSSRLGEAAIKEVGYRGQVHLAADKGALMVDLSGLEDALGPTPNSMPREVEMRWQDNDFWLGTSGQMEKRSRAEAAESGGALGLLPRSVATDLGLLAKATEVTAVQPQPDPETDWHQFRFKLPADSGQTQLQTGSVWLSADGTPMRAQFEGQGRSLPSLPVRAHAMTLEFSDWGTTFQAPPPSG